jgi:hypothetical protein
MRRRHRIGPLHGLVALALDPMHHASRARIERLAMMHYAAVVPDKKISHAPLVMPRQLRLRRMRPQRFEDFLRFFDQQPVDIGIRPASEI